MFDSAENALSISSSRSCSEFGFERNVDISPIEILSDMKSLLYDELGETLQRH